MKRPRWTEPVWVPVGFALDLPKGEILKAKDAADRGESILWRVFHRDGRFELKMAPLAEKLRSGRIKRKRTSRSTVGALPHPLTSRVEADIRQRPSISDAARARQLSASGVSVSRSTVRRIREKVFARPD